jgi:flagellar biosynthesis protein FliQ
VFLKAVLITVALMVLAPVILVALAIGLSLA